MEKPIGIFDSGIGGLSVLNKLKELLPNESFVYLADNINCPYGNKSKKEIVFFSIKNTSKLIELNCKKVIVPEHKSRIGNPVILPRNYFKILRSLKNDFGARSLIKKKDIITFKTGFGTIFDIDTRDELTKTKPNF